MEVRYEEDIDNSFIGGGISNCITGAGSFVGGGCCNSIISSAVWGVLVGGRCNQINGSASDSAILGGICNSLGGNCSAIFGGCNNSIPAALCFAGVFGCNIAAVCSNAFHIDQLVACGIPNGTASTCTGYVYYGCLPSLGFPWCNCKILMII